MKSHQYVNVIGVGKVELLELIRRDPDGTELWSCYLLDDRRYANLILRKEDIV